MKILIIRTVEIVFFDKIDHIIFFIYDGSIRIMFWLL